MNEDRHHPLSGLRPPGAPPGLRRRVLDAARNASAEPAETSGAPGPRLTDGLWESRPLWLAWALLVVALVGVNLQLDVADSRPAEGAAGAERHALEELPKPSFGTSGAASTLLASRARVFRAVFDDGGGSPSAPAPTSSGSTS